jgi:hypothetical protein
MKKKIRKSNKPVHEIFGQEEIAHYVGILRGKFGVFRCPL